MNDNVILAWIILIGLFVVLPGVIVLVSIRAARQRARDAAVKRRIEDARAKAAKAEEDRKWLELGKQCQLSPSLSAEETRDEIRERVHKSFTQRLLVEFENSLKYYWFVETYSSLGTCYVSKGKLHYNIETIPEIRSGKGAYSRDFCKSELNHPKAINLPSMNLSDIKFYRVEGAVHYTTEVSGGGVNMQGAMAGYVLAGGAAAIIGSQVGTEIKSSTTQHDERRLLLYHLVNGTLKVDQIATNDIDTTLTALRQLIPQKEETYLLTQRSYSGN